MRIGQTADLVVVAPATADLLAKAAHGLRRRPAHQHPAHRPLPGRVRPGDAHRDVGAPRHPGQRRHAARARRPGDRARRGPADRRRHRQGPAARARRDLRARPRRAGPRAAPPTRSTWPAGTCVVSAGGTREYLDPVRFLGNRSSGLQGYALARAAAARGAEVTLVAANVDAARPGRRQGGARRDHRAAARRGARRRRRRRRRGDGRRARRLPARPRSATPRSRRPTTARRRRIELTQNPDILAEICPRPGPARVGDRRLRRRDRRRHRLGARPGPRQAGPQGLRPAGRQRRERGRGVRQPRQRGRGPRRRRRRPTDVPRGSKAALAHVDLGPGRGAGSRPTG